jgi:chemotaxis protein MotB
LAAEKKGQTIVIKKIYVVAGGHGGAWKVALADFMTAMMAFFLVMWLLNQTEETKKAVSDYFSTPSIIEYNFQNFGAVLTLEKLFLDLLSEPLKAFQSFLEPADRTPNLLDMGSQKVIAAYMADKMQDVAKNVSISPDGFEFTIIDSELFYPGTATPIAQYLTVMDRLKTLTVGLEDSTVTVESLLFNQSVQGSNPTLANQVASERLDLVKKKLEASFEQPTNEVIGNIKVRDNRDFIEGQTQRPPGLIKIIIRQKELRSDGTKPRKLERVFGEGDANMTVYDNFVKQVTSKPTKEK